MLAGIVRTSGKHCAVFFNLGGRWTDDYSIAMVIPSLHCHVFFFCLSYKSLHSIQCQSSTSGELQHCGIMETSSPARGARITVWTSIIMATTEASKYLGQPYCFQWPKRQNQNVLHIVQLLHNKQLVKRIKLKSCSYHSSVCRAVWLLTLLRNNTKVSKPSEI